jgi:hypothetical protein
MDSLGRRQRSQSGDLLMQANPRTVLGLLGLAFLAIVTFFVTTYFIGWSGSRENPIQIPDSSASIRNQSGTRRVSGSVPPPPQKPVKLSPRGILASGHTSCSKFAFTDNAIELKAKVEYETIQPNLTFSWEIQIFSTKDFKKPVFVKSFPDKTVKLATRHPYTWNFEDKTTIPIPLAAGHYRGQFVGYEQSPKAKKRSVHCTTGFEVK